MRNGVILFVEDDLTLQTVVCLALGRLGYEARAVATGEEAIAFDRSKLLLIFMDVGLPGINGDEATARIRKNEAENGRKHVPIIALTAHSIEAQCLQAGMDDFLQKPALLEDLQSMIERWAPEPEPALRVN